MTNRPCAGQPQSLMSSPLRLLLPTRLFTADLRIKSCTNNLDLFSASYSFLSSASVQPILRSHKQRSEEHTSELQSPCNLVCRLLLEKKKNSIVYTYIHSL